MRNETDIVCCNCVPWIGCIPLTIELLIEIMSNLIDEILNKDIRIE